MKACLGALLLCLYLGYSQACTCQPKTVKQKYCDADFVVKLQVKKKMKNPSRNINEPNAYYTVRMLEGYKQRNWYYRGVDMTRVYTAAGGHMCGVELEKGRKYILSGTIQNTGKLRINSCGSIIHDMSTLSPELTKVLWFPPRCINPMFIDPILKAGK